MAQPTPDDASSRAAAPPRLDHVDAYALLALTFFAFVLRFASPIMPDFFAHPLAGSPVTNCVSSTPVDAKGTLGTLCGLAYPYQTGSGAKGAVFDEVYFPADAYHDFKGVLECTTATKACPDNYFDPEPPLSKLLIGAGELTDGWYLATFTGASGSYIDLGNNTFGWRLFACLFGILLIPLLYLLARRLYPPRFFAISAAFLACFDGMFFLQSRIGMIDVFAIFFIVLIYYLFLVHLQSKTSRSSLLSLLALGAALGLGVASKWIVLAAFPVVGLVLGLEMVRRKLPWLDAHLWPRLSLGAIPGAARALLYWPTLVFSLVVLPVALYLASWFPFFMRGQFHSLSDVIAYNRESFVYHATLVATHPFSSPWWSWPLLSRPVYYYAQGELGIDAWTGQSLVAQIYNIGNPWIWWTALLALLALPYFIFWRRSFPATLITLGFLTQYLPWSQIHRVTFLYHMFAGSLFMILALAFVLTKIYEHRAGVGRAFAISHLALALLAFCYFYPIWTGIPLGNSALNAGPGTPVWGAKAALNHCTPNVTPQQPQLWCWP